MMDRARFAGQVVIVTGASRGIGRATALAFAAEGAHVMVNYRTSAASAEETLAAIRSAGGTATLVQADIGSRPDCARLMEAAEAVGPVEVLVNNAAAISRSSILNAPMLEVDRVWDVNVRGAYFLSQLAARSMAQRRQGAIIFVSSILAQLTMPDRTAYAASKGAVEALTRAMALDLAPYNVRVNAVAPGLIETQALLTGFASPEVQEAVRGHIPSQRFGQPAEVAAAILFLASAEASYVNGVVLPVDSALGVREARPAP